MAVDRPSRPEHPLSRVAPRYEHVVFDLDGTLVDSCRDISGSVNHVLEELGRRPLPLSVVTGLVGDGARTLMARALGAGAESLLDRALARFLDHYRSHLLDTTEPYPGVRELLDELVTRGLTLSVLSNKPGQLVERILSGLGLDGALRASLGGDALPTRKPDPSGLQHLLAGARVGPERALLVGDSSIDRATARAGGVAFCGALWGYGAAGLRDEPVVADRPSDVLAVIAAPQDAIAGSPR